LLRAARISGQRPFRKPSPTPAALLHRVLLLANEEARILKKSRGLSVKG
jgi:hypothetical protein